MDDLFWDEERGGWFNTTGADPTVILRLKEDYDGAEPAASSMGVLNLLTLAHLTADPDLVQRMEKTLRAFGPRLRQTASAMPMMLAALSTYHATVSQIVIVGSGAQTAAADDLMREVRAKYLPFSVIVPVEAGARQAGLARVLPFIASMEMRDGRPTAYVCRDFTCGAPATDPRSLAVQLDRA
jgi:uncharacterized protein YyaL (SSP411 family)